MKNLRGNQVKNVAIFAGSVPEKKIGILTCKKISLKNNLNYEKIDTGIHLKNLPKISVFCTLCFVYGSILSALPNLNKTLG